MKTQSEFGGLTGLGLLFKVACEMARIEHSPPHQHLAELIITTKVDGWVRLAEIDQDKTQVEPVRMTLPVLSFAKPGWGFVLKSHEEAPDAPLSPYYFHPNDATEVLGLGSLLLRQEIEDALLYQRVQLRPGVRTGIPEGGLKLSAYYPVSEEALPNLKLLEKIQTPTGRRIVMADGAKTSQGEGLLLFDDTLTGGKSLEEAIKVVISPELNYVVSAVGVIMDRQQGGSEIYTGIRQNSRLHIASVFRASELMPYLSDARLITPEQYNRFIDYYSLMRKKG